MRPRLSPLLLSLVLAGAACGSDAATSTPADETTTAVSPTVAVESSTVTEAPATTTAAASSAAPVNSLDPAPSRFEIQVWADNWMAVSVDGVLVGEDSVAITTERSFNAETFAFEATYPFTVAIEAKDFKETDSGIEYIGEGNQQMGDGGLIAQIIDSDTGEVVAVTDSTWQTLVVHRAPLNKECEKSADPDADCLFEFTDTPTDWTSPGFDDSAWTAATVWTAADVSPKDGYDQIEWDDSAQLVWGADLEADNTVLLRRTITAAS